MATLDEFVQHATSPTTAATRDPPRRHRVGTGAPPDASSVEDALVKLQYDLYYSKHCNPVLDASILIRTLGLVLTLRGR